MYFREIKSQDLIWISDNYKVIIFQLMMSLKLVPHLAITNPSKKKKKLQRLMFASTEKKNE